MSIQTVEIALPTGIDSVSVGLAEPISIVEVRQGAGGEPGAAGPAGATGPAGPNTVTTATTTNLTGFISGNGTNIAGATAAASAATANTLVLRDANGGASLEYPTFGSGFQITEAGGSDTFGMRSATGDTWSMYGPDYGDFMSFSKAGVITFSPSGFAYGAGAASAHRTALGLGATGSITASDPLTLTQTWTNAAVTYTGLQVNVTDTASNAASLLMDLQVGGVSQLSVRKDGRVFFGNNGIDAIWTVGGRLQFTAGGAGPYLGVQANGVIIQNSASLSFSSSPSPGDTILVRDGAANTLAQRNGNAAQESRIYGTYTGPGNYRRLALKMDTAGVAQIVAEGGGSGASANRLEFVTGGATRMTVEAGGGVTLNSVKLVGAEFSTLAGTATKINLSFFCLQYGNQAGLGVSWSDTTNPSTSKSVAIQRSASGVVEINNNTSGEFRDLKLRNLTASGTIQTGGYTFANLPSPATQGMRAYITDGAALPLYMANAAGGGSTVTPVFYNGTNWINA
jgi:hypothetical protein